MERWRGTRTGNRDKNRDAYLVKAVYAHGEHAFGWGNFGCSSLSSSTTAWMSVGCQTAGDKNDAGIEPRTRTRTTQLARPRSKSMRSGALARSLCEKRNKTKQTIFENNPMARCVASSL